jgi:hypothetical protein
MFPTILSRLVFPPRIDDGSPMDPYGFGNLGEQIQVIRDIRILLDRNYVDVHSELAQPLAQAKNTIGTCIGDGRKRI